MNKRFLISFFIPFLLIGCSNTPGTSTSGSADPSAASTSVSGSDTPSIGPSTSTSGNEYDKWCNSWSQPGHMYLHYNRGADKTDYDNYCLWLWQFAPQNLEGTLWAYSADPVVSTTLTLEPMSTNWMTHEQVGKQASAEPYFKDEYGVICDVDLYKSDLVGGKSGIETTFIGAQEVGFLMVRQDSMDGSTNWTSDGGKETYIDEFGDEENWRTLSSGGSCIHVFISSGALNKYSFYQGDGTPEVKVNPVEKDTTKKFVSNSEDIADTYGLSSTSAAAKELGVGYQIFVASFRDSNGDGVGDIRGIIESLDYLSDLGVDVLWLTPIQQSDSYHGYDISDYYAVDKKFGTIEDYRELLYKAHQKGMKVLMDLVLNHTSKNNIWYSKSQWAVNSGEDGCEADTTGIKWRDVYTWKYATDTITVRNYDPVTLEFDGTYKTTTVEADAKSQGPSWYRDGESNYYYYGKFGSGMPEINYNNAQTRELVINMAKYWLAFGLDGFRLDAVKHIYMEDEVATSSGDVVIADVGSKRAYDDEKGQYVTKPYDYSSNLSKNVSWWKHFANELKATYPNCFLVGENFDGWGTRIAPYYQALDSQFDFSTYYHIPAWLYTTGMGGASNFINQPAETYDTFSGNGPYPLDDGKSPIVYVEGGKRPDFINGAFTSNHDVMRAINQANGTGSKQSTTAKDKITGTTTEYGKAKVAAATTILNPGISWIYYGDELGMSSNTDQFISKYDNENCMDICYRQPFLWSDTSKCANYKNGQYQIELDSHNASLDKIEYTINEGASTYTVKTDNEMFAYYKALCDIKHQYPRGAKVTFTGSSENVLVINVTGSGKGLKIYVSTGYSNAEYLLNPGSNYSLYKSVGATLGIGDNIGATNYAVAAFKEN